MKNVSTAWTTVNLDNTYTDAIPVCTYVLESFVTVSGIYTNPPAVTRIQNITASSFELRIQGWEDSSASTADVHCIVVDSGAHTLPDGRLVEAHSVLSDDTTGKFADDGTWQTSTWENVSSSIVHSYTAPVVLGQVMSYNDYRASAIHVNDCDSRTNQPFQSGMSDGMCVANHIGKISGDRSAETIGYIVAETGSGTVNNVFYELAVGSDSIAGNNNSNSGGTYAMNAQHSVAVLTQAGEDGGDGSWAVLYGSDPIGSNSIGLVVDEEGFAVNASRAHTNEPVAYWAFSAAEITLVKNVVNASFGTATIDDFPLTAAGPNVVTGVSGTSAITNVLVPPGTYQLTEETLPGYVASEWVCTGATSVSGNSVELSVNEDVVCTISNEDKDTAVLTLVKQVVNTALGTAVAADFEVFFTGPGGADSGFTGDATVTSVLITSGLYDLSETTVAGYNLVEINCDGADSIGTDGVQVVAGEEVTCVFINSDAPTVTTLTLKKVVTNDNGGTATEADFELNYSGPGGSQSGFTGDASMTQVPVTPGTYSLSESKISGYTLEGITCDGIDKDGSDGVDITLGENVTCSFINNDNGIDLSIVKTADNTEPNIGDVLTFSLDITNSGPGEATDVQVIDQIPAGFSYVAASMVGGDIRNDSSPSGSGLNWLINSMPSGTSITLSFQVTVEAP